MTRLNEYHTHVLESNIYLDESLVKEINNYIEFIEDAYVSRLNLRNFKNEL